MAEFFDYNPDRGTWYETDFRDDGSFTICTKQDLAPVIDYARRERNSGRNDQKLKDDYFERYALIPAWVEVELKTNHGIDIYNKHQTKELLRIINRDYPWLKVTNRHHE